MTETDVQRYPASTAAAALTDPTDRVGSDR